MDGPRRRPTTVQQQFSNTAAIAPCRKCTRPRPVFWRCRMSAEAAGIDSVAESRRRYRPADHIGIPRQVPATSRIPYPRHTAYVLPVAVKMLPEARSQYNKRKRCNANASNSIVRKHHFFDLENIGAALRHSCSLDIENASNYLVKSDGGRASAGFAPYYAMCFSCCVPACHGLLCFIFAVFALYLYRWST